MKGTLRNLIYLIFIVIFFIFFSIFSVKTLTILQNEGSRIGFYLIFQIIVLFILVFTFLFLTLKGLLYFIYEKKHKVIGRKIRSKFFVIIFLVIIVLTVPFGLYHVIFTNYLLKKWGGVLVESTISNAVDLSQYIISKGIDDIIKEAGKSSPEELEALGINISGKDITLDDASGIYLDGSIFVKYEGILYSRELDEKTMGYLTAIEKNYYDHQQDESFRKEASKYFIIVSIIVITILLFVLTMWIAGFLGKDIIFSIENLISGAVEVQKGNYDHKIEKVSSDELGLLIDRFNEMTATIRENRDNLIKLNEEIEAERDFQKLIPSLLTTPILILDQDNNEVFRNSAYDRLLKGMNIDLYREFLNESLKEFIKKKIPTKKKLRIDNRFFQMIIVPFEVPYLGKIIIVEDFTEALNLRRVEIWQEMARQLAHELKNPLTPISLAIDRMKLKYKKGDDDFEGIFMDNIKVIKEEIKRLSNLLTHFNNFARMPPADIKVINIKDLIESVIELYKENSEKDIGIGFEFKCKNENIYGDELLLKQVFVNLFANSIDSIEKKGSIDIKVECENNDMMIMFSDNGCGIDSNDIPYVFDLYFSKKKGGTGLGLTMVKKIIDEHNGSIEIRSAPGDGTVFIIDLRSAEDEMPNM